MVKLQQFIERLQRMQSLGRQQDALVGFLNGAGFRYFTYHIVKVRDRPGLQPLFATNYPDEWVRHYGAQGYLAHDPLVQEGPRRQLPFRWSDVTEPRDMDRVQRRLFREASDFGISNGLTIPLHGRDGEYAALNLIPDGTPEDQARTIDQQGHMAHLLAFYWHSLAGTRLLEEQGRSFPEDVVGTTLSDREREVLTWVARGKSAWDTARILGLSERTVVYHIENAKRKLNATTRTHLVVKAVMERLIEP